VLQLDLFRHLLTIFRLNYGYGPDGYHCWSGLRPPVFDKEHVSSGREEERNNFVRKQLYLSESGGLYCVTA
jgi:hypothetical protein